MFDEYTRMVDGWHAHLAYLDEEKKHIQFDINIEVVNN